MATDKVDKTFLQHARAQFKTYDVNGNGKIDKETAKAIEVRYRTWKASKSKTSGGALSDVEIVIASADEGAAPAPSAATQSLVQDPNSTTVTATGGDAAIGAGAGAGDRRRSSALRSTALDEMKQNNPSGFVESMV
jgi:hypothetical protein